MKQSIAIVGMACRYPDADTPSELWENVLAKRRAFRRLPDERLRESDYVSEDRSETDKTYRIQGAVLEGFEFDRQRFRVPGDTFRSADMAHWLALQVAAEALEDAGCPDGRDLPRDATGVLLGNTLTGEFSRANVMRLRWPYVRRVVDAALSKEDWSAPDRRDFLERLEPQYKAPFPEMGGETLAGGLANTIAGRICNQFDLHGGGYTVDGACASSLLAVSQAASALVAGDLDVALAGGVDLSLDPFELVGFARLGALAPHQMHIYDERSAGFWPGEGCGVVVLMREEDAVAQGKRIYATLHGWGVSSDGHGGLTRPEVEGQLMAVRRAYKRAAYGADTVAYFEGHGTGTAVGDPAEIQVLSQAIVEAAAQCPQDRSRTEMPPAGLGSIKANIGHTKAAAGTAGLIKAVLAIHHRILPPTTACTQPTALLREETAALRVLQEAEAWPQSRAVRASVSAMGFGGINTHMTLSEPQEGRASRTVRSRRVVDAAVAASRSSQDSELFCLRTATHQEMTLQVDALLQYAHKLSLSELTDLSHTLARRAQSGRLRAAVLAATPQQLTLRLQTLRSWLTEESEETAVPFRADEAQNIFLSMPLGDTAPRIGLLFPGQASPSYLSGGAWSNRFAVIQELYGRLALDRHANPRETAVAQPAICAAERAGMLALRAWGIEAHLAIGHSVGELSALHWAGVYDEDTLLRLARARGACMSKFGERQGAMLSVGADAERASQLVQGTRVVVAGMNAPEQTILSGDADDMQDIMQRAVQQGLQAVELRVSHAFHSPHMQGAMPALRDMLRKETWRTPQSTVFSTISGQVLSTVDGLSEQLVQQLVQPVRFTEALQAAASQVDIWIECGPGTVLTGLVRQQSPQPVVSLDAGSASLAGLLRAFATCWSAGADLQPETAFDNRFTRAFDIEWQPRFLENPCEAAPFDAASAPLPGVVTTALGADASTETAITVSENGSPLDVVRQTVADHLELPVETVQESSLLLTDLHLNSITISEIVGQAARALGMHPPQAVTEFANASVGDIAAALATLLETGVAEQSTAQRIPEGIDRWVRAFEVEWVEVPLVVGAAAHAPDYERRGAVPDTEKPGKAGTWKIVAPENHPFEPAARRLFNDGYGEGGVVVCMPTELAGCCADLMLQAARQALALSGETTFVVVENLQAGGAPGGGFARTLHLENPRIHTCVVDLPWEEDDAIDWLDAEVAAIRGFQEVRYTADGTRLLPHLQLAQRLENQALQLGPEDVLVVTGGGKGIAAECALALARQTGVRLGLMGRSHPDQDSELAGNLQRLQAFGVQVHYARADVTDADAVQGAVDEIVAALGAVTVILHGAGINHPRLIQDLDEVAFRRTFAPKVIGLRNILNAVPADTLRGLITFSSIIGRTGLAGEADYALANEWASRVTEMFAEQQPQCRCMSLEWSVWSGSGMGERLGRIETLRQQGIADTPTDEGVATLIELLQNPPRNTSVVVAGRFGDPNTVAWNRKALPLRRFIESPRVHIPGVELVVDAQVSALTDPYLQDHVVQRQPLFPAVLGLEAMAQVAMALQDTGHLPVFEDVQFQRPVVVEKDAIRTIRLAALQTEPHCVTVVLRSDANDFHVDHFRAVCRFDVKPLATDDPTKEASQVPSLELQAAPMYDGNLLFHRGRFQRLKSYRALHARACDADLASDGSTEWFGTYMPRDLCLGDPAARDAAIHAIQACIPHARLLPIGVDRIYSGFLQATMPHRVRATEREQHGDEYVYDMHIEDMDGRVVEAWEGLRLRRMERITHAHAWQPELFGPYAERRMQELAGSGQARVVVLRDRDQANDDRTQAALRYAVGGPVTVWRRGDGRPQIVSAQKAPVVSATHAQGFTLAMSGVGRLGCDLQEISARDTTGWLDLLGQARFSLAQHLAAQSHCSLDAAATQVWSAMECLKKAGMGSDAPLVLNESAADGWTTFRSGSVHIATCVTDLVEAPHSMAVALLTEAADASV